MMDQNCWGQILSIAAVWYIDACEFLNYVNNLLPKTDSSYLLGSFLCLHVATVAVSYIWSLYCVHLHSYNSSHFLTASFPSLSKIITPMVKPSGHFVHQCYQNECIDWCQIRWKCLFVLLSLQYIFWHVRRRIYCTIFKQSDCTEAPLFCILSYF